MNRLSYLAFGRPSGVNGFAALQLICA